MNANIDDNLKGLVGLQNLGNTCYMNGALQALSNCQQLTRFVLDCPGFIKNTGLSRCYSELINEIWNSKNSQYAVPSSIIRNIRCIYPAFRGCTQQDTQEFLRCFLEQLHDELKQPPIKKHPASKKQQKQISNAASVDTSCSSSSSPIPSVTSSRDDARDEAVTNEETRSQETSQASTGNHFSDFHQHQRSIISDTFEFRISSSIVCSSCNNISTTKETFKDLSVPIPCRDHPYYQQTSDHSDNNASSIPTEQQSISNHLPSSTVSNSTSSNGIDSSQMTSGKASDTLNSNSSIYTENSMKASNESSSDEQRHTDMSEDEVEIQTSSYLNSIPLARWLLNWFSQLGSWFWGPQVTLYDCLSVFFGTDPLEGDNEYSCEVCTKKNRGVKFLKILELPEVLCIHFKRYESVGSAKITTHVSFPLTGLDLAPFMDPDSRPQCTTYNLIACICHHGSALLTGHYTTYALNCYDDQWYEFDDQYVTCVSSYQVENSEAYILFYQKSTLDDTIDRQRVIASKLLKKSLRQEALASGLCISSTNRAADDEDDSDDDLDENDNYDDDEGDDELAPEQNGSSSESRKYFISKQWVNKFNTFVEPGPITNHDFLCEHLKVPPSSQKKVTELCHPISKSVWKYLTNLHGGGPECCELLLCDTCE